MRHIWSPFKKFNTTYFHNTQIFFSSFFSFVFFFLSPRFFFSLFLSAFFHESCRRRRRHASRDVSIIYARCETVYMLSVYHTAIWRSPTSHVIFIFLLFLSVVRGGGETKRKSQVCRRNCHFSCKTVTQNTVIAVSIIITSESRINTKGKDMLGECRT